MAIGSPQWMYNSGSDYELEQSLRFEDGRSTFLSRTPAANGNRRTWTMSYWIKRGSIADHKAHFGGSEADSASVALKVQFDGTTQQLQIANYRSGYHIDWICKSNMGFRDTSAWYHIVIAVDTTQGTASNRVKLYANGELLTLTTATYPSQNFESFWNENNLQTIGCNTDNEVADNFYEGYMSEMNFLDGVVASPADFGETGTYGEWKPIEYKGSYGTNGFHLPFKQDYAVEGFSAVTWAGNTTDQYIGGVGFNPDLVWIKHRNGAGDHMLMDSIRGVTKNLLSNTTAAEETRTEGLQAFSADGYTLGTNDGNLNRTARTYAGWNWDMGADTPTGFGCVTYTGNGATGQTISGVGFQPDFLWIKNRTDGDSSFLYDAVRGAKNYLQSDAASAQATTNQMTAFNGDGFTVDEDGGSATNDDGDNFVAWAWNMGGSNASNTSGSINSTVRANTTYGQSIVSYTGNGTAGATVGHGLNSTPEMIIVKNTQNNYNWQVFHTSIGNTGAVFLDLGSAPDTGETTYWNDTSPTNALFSLGTNTKANGNNNPHIAYCFHSVSGYSKFGSYSGNGSATGTSVTTGFRPAFLMIKKNAASNWLMFDNVRSDSIVTDIGENLHADYPRSEAGCASAQIKVDFNATGFQLKGTSADINGNGDTYIYMCFAGGADAVSTVNTTGSLDSRVKANSTYGQSIVSYVGNGSNNQTVGHGLSSAPEMIIYKDRENANNDWKVYHSSIGNAKDLRLNDAAAEGSSTAWGSTTPTSSLFTVNGSNTTNINNNDSIAYCFHSVSGYSKFSSYTGDGTYDGSKAVTLGFSPAFVMIKCTNDTENWIMYDSTRSPLSTPFLGGKRLQANIANAEIVGGTTGSDLITFTATGFKMTGQGGGSNGNNNNYVYAAFADKREYAYWLDQSGNNNDWTSNNLTESDISVDSPSNNMATMNPLFRGMPSTGDVDSAHTLSEGNLKMRAAGNKMLGTTIIPTSGKWYAEFYVNAQSTYGPVFGWVNNEYTYTDLSTRAGLWKVYSRGAGDQLILYPETASSVTLASAALHNGDIIQFAWDCASGKAWIGRNNTWYNASLGTTGNPATGANPTITTTVAKITNDFTPYIASSDDNSTVTLNFGQDSSFAGNKTAQGNQDGNDIGDFHYTPPTGFLALCTSNLPAVAVVPSEHFAVQTRTGFGSSGGSLTTNFAVDFLWEKQRNYSSDHNLWDAVRGRPLYLSSNTTDVDRSGTWLTSFNSNGVTFGSNDYDSGTNLVDWMWKANGSGSSNTDGSINTTKTSANVDAGFSIMTYTGTGSNATIGHGLSKTPEMWVVKPRTNVSDNQWFVCHKGLASDYATDFIHFDSTGAVQDNALMWNDTPPTSTVINLGSKPGTNGSGGSFVAYAWHSVDGYSAVGSYKGNGVNLNGPFVYTGFRPAYVMIKRTDSADPWVIFDSAREPENEDDGQDLSLKANDTAVEAAYGNIDFLSNGFKVMINAGYMNNSGSNYIYLAFAETPFKYSNAR